MKIDPATFLQRVAEYTVDTTATSADRPLRLGTIDAAYGGVGLPRVLFDGELTVSSKQYALTGDYRPAAGDRVVLAPVGTTYLILGPVTETIYTPPPIDTWHDVSFGNSWSNLAGWQTAQYRKEAGNVVRLRGVIIGGVKTEGVRLTTLPAGYRPDAAEIFPVGNATSSGVLPNIRIQPDGDVLLYGMSASTNGAHSWSGITYVVP